jgi:hypothetical protein
MSDSRSQTAGLRGAHWNEADLPATTVIAVSALRTADGATCARSGFSAASSSTAVLIMHPREYLPTHYLVPYILSAGADAYVQAPRSPGNDLRLEHEMALLDVAAGVQSLRAAGYKHVILLGNSGGAALFAFYIEQASKAAGLRLERTIGGRPVALNDVEMPTVDGLVLVSPHPGQGKLLLNALDPSLIEEGNIELRDNALDPFLAENGHRSPPASSGYSPDFVTRYREAQVSRCTKLDELAVGLLEERKQSRKAGQPKGWLQQIMAVYGTDADLRCWDINLDPSARQVGSLWGKNPFASNFGAVGFGRVCTPESWLSTWSGLRSLASFDRCAGAISLPVLQIEYDADNSVFPSEAAKFFACFPSSDKQRMLFPGDHHGHAVGPDGKSGRNEAGQAIGEWIRARYHR